MMEQINQILSDPDNMKQIMELASVFGENSGDISQDGVSGAIPAGISQALNQVQAKEAKQQALVQALLPYLRPNHQKRLERAIQIARLSHLAGAALKSENLTIREEQEHDV